MQQEVDVLRAELDEASLRVQIIFVIASPNCSASEGTTG